jgi:hypothetical protein
LLWRLRFFRVSGLALMADGEDQDDVVRR